MKKIYISLTTIAVIVAAASCQKENDRVVEVAGPGLATINAIAQAIGSPTSKVEVSPSFAVLWKQNDTILVKNASKSATYTLSDGIESTKGKFTCADPPFSKGDYVQAYYPAEIANGSKLIWPANQQYVNLSVPMYCAKTLGGSSKEEFNFSSLGGIMQIVFNATVNDITLTSIEIMDNKKPLSGDFTIDAEGKAVINPSNSKAGITLDLGEGLSLGRGVHYFNVAVPAGVYENLTVTYRGTTNLASSAFYKSENCRVDVAHNAVGRLIQADKFDVPVTELSLEASSAKAYIGDNFTLSATILPSDATNKAVSWSSDNTSVATVDQGGKITIAGIGIATITATTVDGGKTATCEVVGKYFPADALKGQFSISEEKKVYFSRGNLCARKVNNVWTWGFYAEQYMFNSLNGGNTERTAQSTDSEIDLFAWGYSDDSVNPIGNGSVSRLSLDLSRVEDWGTYAGEGGLWRTLTHLEWLYILESRTTASGTAPTVNGAADARWMKCKVNGTAGLMIFPDVFAWPSSVGKPNKSYINKSDLSWSNAPSYTALTFKALEEAGIVFLPAAGTRGLDSVSQIGKEGYYWSASLKESDSDLVLSFEFDSSAVSYTSEATYRHNGSSVRLVIETKMFNDCYSSEQYRDVDATNWF